jgi:branched-chain amino acid transport system substrate-binding protein
MLGRVCAAWMAGLAMAASAQTPVKIGFLGELSGPQMAYGQDMYDGFMLAVEQGGGKLVGVPVQVLKEDTQLKPDLAAQIVQRLIEKEQVPIIAGVSFSNIMMAIHKQVTDRQVFLVGSNAGPAPIAGAQCSPYYFAASRQNDQQAEAMGRYAKEKGLKKVVTLAPNYQGGKDTVAGFRRSFGQPLQDEIYTPLGQLDFSVELAQIASIQPEAIYVFYPSSLGVAFLKQFRQAGLADKVKLLSMGTVDALTLPGVGQGAQGALSATYWAPDSPLPASVKFAADFEKKTGRIPSEVAAASFDAAHLIGSALAKVKGNVAGDKKGFMAAMRAAQFESVRGKFRFNPNQFPVQDFYIVEAAPDAKGRMNLRRVATYADMSDSYGSQCAPK